MSWLSTVQMTCVSLRPDRPVDQAADQRFLLGRTAFTLEETTGDLAGGERLFLVIDRQREEILAGLSGFGTHDGAEHRGLAVSRHDGAIGLTGDLAGLQDQLSSAPFDFFSEDVEHHSFLPSDTRHIPDWMVRAGAFSRSRPRVKTGQQQNRLKAGQGDSPAGIR
jgi:hypothetical protein